MKIELSDSEIKVIYSFICRQIDERENYNATLHNLYYKFMHLIKQT